MSVVLAEAVDTAVRRLLTEQNGAVEGLVREALDRHLAELVAAELEARPAAIPTDLVGKGSKVCRVCHNERLLSEYESGRGTCRPCRRRQERERAARRLADPASADEPRPAALTASRLHEIADALPHALPAATLEQWLLAKRFAVKTPGGLVPTDVGLELGGAIG